jgi:predicted Zn-dependent peptidase
MNLRVFAAIVGALLLAQTAPGQLDRSKAPSPGPAPAVAFPEYILETTPNGMRVIIVRNDKLPTVSMRLVIDREAVVEGEAAGYIGIAGQLMRNGTKTRTKDQLDEAVDRIGASLGSGSTAVFASGLSKYTPTIFELMADITLHPSFPQAELEKVITQTKSGLKFRKTEPNAIVEVLRQKVLYGANHPYGEVETEETVGKVTRAKCLEAYNAYFKPNHAILAVVGNVDKAQVMKLVQKYFGTWKKGTIPTPGYPVPKPMDGVRVALVDRAASVQSVIRVAQTVELQRTSRDVIPVEVMNTVLGGGVFRLFMNLREKHAYTYGAYSNMGPDKLIGAFTASTSVANKYTDSSITEIFNEIRRIRDEKVEAKELQMAKSYLSGAFARSLETADNIASRAIEIERYNLPKDYYKTYLTRIDAVTADEVQRVAAKYLQPDRMLVALVASAKEVKDKLSGFGPLTMYDEDGNRVVEKPVATTMTVDQILAKFVEKIGGKEKMAALKDRTLEFSGKMQNMAMTVKTIQKAPGKVYQEMGMMGMVQKSGFDGEKGWASGPQGSMDMSGEQLEGMKMEGAMNFYDSYKQLGYAAELTGRKDVRGTDCFEISFTKPSAPLLKHYFGVADFMKKREVTTMQSPQGPVEQTADLFDYKDFKGYLVPTRLEQSVMGQSMEFKLEKCEVNTGVPDSLFQKPAK